MKQFKRIIAMVMTVAMCLGLAVTASATTTPTQTQGALDQYTITVKGGDIDKVTDVTQNNHQYRAYQIFTGDVNKNAQSRDELSITGWGADVDGPAIVDALKADPRFQTTPNPTAPVKPDDYDTNTTAAAAYDAALAQYQTDLAAAKETNLFKDVTGYAGVASVISKWKDGAKTGAEARADINRMTDYFAEVVAANLKPDAATAGSALTWDGTNKQYVSGQLDEGYYLVKDLGTAAAADDFISKNIIELLGGNVEVSPKGSIPQVLKGVADADSNGIKNGTSDTATKPYEATPPTNYVENDAVEANVGDTVYYTVKGTVSDMIQDYTTYYFKFVDKMSKGLDFGTAANANARDALSKTVSELNQAISAANTQKQNADDALAALPGQIYPEDTTTTPPTAAAATKADVETRDAAAVTAAEQAVETAEAAVTAAQGAIDSAADQTALDAANAQMQTAQNQLTAANNQLSAAKAAQTAHNKQFTDAEAAVTTAVAAQNKANQALADRNAAIDDAAEHGDISTTELWKPETSDGAKDGGEAALLKMDRSTLDSLNQSRYDAALQKALQSTVDQMKATSAGNLKVYAYRPATTAGGEDTLLGIVDPSCYEVIFTPNEGIDGGDKLEIEFADLLTITDTNGGTITLQAKDYLVAVYSAVVNEEAVIGNPGNTNEVELVYSRDPDSDEEGSSKSTPNDAVVFTFEMDINKIDKNSKTRLTDAGFFLYRDVVTRVGNQDQTTRQYAQFIDNGGGNYTFAGWTASQPVPTAYVKERLTTTPTTDVTTAEVKALAESGKVIELLTTNNGHFEIKGLQSGNYGLIESTVPNGYDPSNLGKTFAMNLQAQFASLSATETKDCINEYNPNYIAKTTYTTEEQEAGIDKQYIDAYGDPTNDPNLRVKNPAYDPTDTTSNKWVKTRTDNGDGTFNNTEFTNTDTEALKETMTLKTYKVDKLSLNGTDYSAENGTAWNDVENSLDVVLPETGGIGTTIFYIVGGILVVGAAVVMITRKRVEG